MEWGQGGPGVNSFRVWRCEGPFSSSRANLSVTEPWRSVWLPLVYFPDLTDVDLDSAHVALYFKQI